MSDMTFGPQWLRDLSAGGPGLTGSTPPPSQPPTPTTYQFKLADHRYGREEMLALYTSDLPMPPSFKSLAPLVKEIPIQPMSFLPFSEDEQRSQVHGVNSNIVLKLVGKAPARGVRTGAAGVGNLKLARPVRPREGNYQRGTPVDEAEDPTGGSIDGFERKFYDTERPGNFRGKGDVSRSGRSSNWRTGPVEDGGSEAWRNSPLSPGPKSPDKWHVVGPRHGWKDQPESRERPQQQGPPRRGSERDRTGDDRESGMFHHRIGGRWDRLNESEEGVREPHSEERWEINTDGRGTNREDREAFTERTEREVREDGFGRERKNREVIMEARGVSQGKRDESARKGETAEKETAMSKAASSLARTEGKLQKTMSNGEINPGHASRVEEQRQGPSQTQTGPKAETTDFVPDPVTGVASTPPRSEQTARLYAAGRGRGRGSATPNRPQLPKVGSPPAVPDAQRQAANKMSATSGPVSVKPRRGSKQDEDEIIEGLEQSAQSVVAGMFEDNDGEMAEEKQHGLLFLHSNPPIHTNAMQQQPPETLKVNKCLAPAQALPQLSVRPRFTGNTAAAPLVSAGQPSLPPLLAPMSLELMNEWLYTDPQGDVQGPFTGEEMFDWMRSGYFRMDLLVKRTCDDEFRPLGELIKLWGRVPFASGKVPPPLLKSGSSNWKQMESLNLAQQQMLAHIQQEQQLQQPQLHQQQAVVQPQHLAQEPVNPVEQHLISSGEESVPTSSSIWSGAPGDIWGLSVPFAGTNHSVWDSSTKASELSSENGGLQSAMQQDDEEVAKEVLRLQEELSKEQEMREAEERDRQIKEEEERLRREEEQRRKREEELRKHEEESRKREEERRRKEMEQRKREEEKQQQQERLKKKQEMERQKKKQEEELKKLQEEALRQQQLALQKQQEAARQKQEAVIAAQQRQLQQKEALSRLQQQQAEAQTKQQQMQQASRVPGWKAAQSSISLLEIQQQEAKQIETERERRLQQQQQQQQLQFQQQGTGWSGKVQGPAAPSLSQIQQEQQFQEHAIPGQQRTPTSDPGWTKPPPTAPAAWNQAAPSAPRTAGRGITPLAPTCGPSGAASFWDTLPPVEQFEQTVASGSRGRGAGLTTPSHNVPPVASTERKVATREEEVVRRYFQAAVTISDSLREWCEEKLAPFRRVVDTPTLIEFLQAVDSASEVNEYVEAYLGTSPAAQEFARGFIERYTKQIKTATVADVIKGQKSSVPPADSYAAFPSLGDSGPTVKSSVGGGNSQVTQQEQHSKQDVAGAKGRRKKKRMQKVPAANFLSYSVNAGERPNKGEMKSAYDAQ